MNWRGALRRLMPYLIAIAGGFLLAYLIAAFAFFPSGAIARDLKVPNVIGLDFETAQQRLRQSGFKAEQGESRFHAAAPKGTVLDQTPPPGSRNPEGSVVTLALSAGQKMSTVPNIVGLTRADAEHALDQAGFDVGDVSEQPSDQPRGTVIDSRPRPSSVAPSPGAVALVVSSGPNVVLVPDVVGRSFAQARQLLQQIGLQVGDVAAEGGGNPNGNALVLSQTPAAGSQVASGSRVSLRVGGATE